MSGKSPCKVPSKVDMSDMSFLSVRTWRESSACDHRVQTPMDRSSCLTEAVAEQLCRDKCLAVNECDLACQRRSTCYHETCVLLELLFGR